MQELMSWNATCVVVDGKNELKEYLLNTMQFFKDLERKTLEQQQRWDKLNDCEINVQQFAWLKMEVTQVTK